MRNKMENWVKYEKEGKIKVKHESKNFSTTF